MAVELPDELILQILSILPAKSLLRCRLVCKSWCCFITSPKFKLMHLHNFNHLNPRYFVSRFDWNLVHEWYNVHLDDEAFTLDHVKFPFPFYISRFKNIWFRIIGCCNGVVCLCDDKGFMSSDFVILWNPSIRRKLTLSLTPRMLNLIEFQEAFVVLGFGYDKMSDDYKVVCLAYTQCIFTRPHVEVYNVKTGIWREVMFPDNLRYFFVLFAWSQVFFNGFVHWIACDRMPGPSHNSIMTFDTSIDLFGELPLPDDLVQVPPTTITISVVGESLAVTYYSRGRMASSTYKIWVMKEYKNPTSWTMVCNVRHPDVDMGKPLKLRNKGDMIMESSDGNVVVYKYNGRASCVCPGYECETDCMTYVDEYQESLALLDVGHSVPNAEAMKALMMIE